MAMPLTAHRFTVEEFQRMGEAGVLHEEARVELIDGQIVEMSPVGVSHTSCVKRLTAAFAGLVAAGRATIGVQDPVVLAPHGQPQPDLSLLRPRRDGYSAAHPEPRDIYLLIEVADTSLAYDRGVKIPAYARAGVSEVWLVNLPAGFIETFRAPEGGRYTEVCGVRRGETLAPAAFPDLTLRADHILG